MPMGQRLARDCETRCSLGGPPPPGMWDIVAYVTVSPLKLLSGPSCLTRLGSNAATSGQCEGKMKTSTS